MKFRKLLATVAALSIAASTFVAAPAHADGAEVKLEFAGYAKAGSATFACIDVYLSLPETLAPYQMVEADWENTFDDTYTGTAIQGVGIDIPNISGLQFVASRSKVYTTDFVAITNNTAAGQVSVAYANTGAYSTYYAGDLGKIAQLQYRITGDVDGTYNLNIDAAHFIANVAKWADGTTNPAPTITAYNSSNTTVTNAVIAPAAQVTTYKVTTDGNATVVKTADSSAVASGSDVEEGTQLTVTATGVAGKTATLYVNGVEQASPYSFTPSSDTTISVTYADIVEYVTVTTDGNVNGVTAGDVVKGSVVTVSAKAVAGKTAQLKANGENIEAGDYTLNENTAFSVVYTDIYTYSVSEFGKNTNVKAIFYKLAIKAADSIMTLGVAGKTFTAKDVPAVDGDAVLTMTYVITDVPDEIWNNVPEVSSLVGGVNGKTYVAK